MEHIWNNSNAECSIQIFSDELSEKILPVERCALPHQWCEPHYVSHNPSLQQNNTSSKKWRRSMCMGSATCSPTSINKRLILPARPYFMKRYVASSMLKPRRRNNMVKCVFLVVQSGGKSQSSTVTHSVDKQLLAKGCISVNTRLFSTDILVFCEWFLCAFRNSRSVNFNFVTILTPGQLVSSVAVSSGVLTHHLCS